MLNQNNPLLLSPEKTPDPIFPYRRVWRATALMIASMLGMVVLILVGVLTGILRDVPSRNWGLLLLLIPFASYLWFSVRAEGRAERPREGLLTVTLFSALLANGVGVPVVDDFFDPRAWLSDAGFFNRALGYTFTYGVTSEFLKYIAIRYTVWPRRLETRMDGIAYSVAAGVGYATILNLRVIFFEQPTVVTSAVRVGINFITQIGFGVIMGYFLAEMAIIPRRSLGFLAGGLFAGSFLQGLYIAFRTIAINSGYINGLILAFAFAMATMLVINFLIETAENRAAGRAGVKRIR